MNKASFSLSRLVCFAGWLEGAVAAIVGVVRPLCAARARVVRAAMSPFSTPTGGQPESCARARIVPSFALAALLALPVAALGQTLTIDPQPRTGGGSQARTTEGGWVGLRVTPSGNAPTGDVTLTCRATLLGSDDVTQGGDVRRLQKTELRASATATEPLQASDPLPTVTLTFNAGNWGTRQTCAFWTYDDLVQRGPTEGSEAGQRWFRVGAQQSDITGSATIGHHTGQGGNGDYRAIIQQNDDPTPTGPRFVDFFPVGTEVAEGQHAVFDVVLSPPRTSSFVVPYTITGGAGITASDFGSNQLHGSYTITVSGAHPGRTADKLRILISDDFASDESAETFTVHLGPPTSVGDVTFIRTTASMTIVADDAADPADVTLSVAAANANVNEGDTAGFTFTLSASYPGELRIRYSLTAGTGTDANDFSRAALGNQFFIIPAGQTTATDVYQVLVDGSAEAAETLTATVVNAGGGRWPSRASPPLVAAASPDHTATITIAASTDTTAAAFADATLTVTPDAVSVAQGANATYTVQLARDPGTNSVTVTPSAAGLTFAPTSLTFDSTNAWNTAQTVTITAASDAATGAVTALNAIASAAGPYGGVTHLNGPVVTVTEPATIGVTISAAALTVEPGADATYTVVLNTEPSGEVTITPATSAAATATVSPGTLTFTTANWNTAQTVTVRGVAAGSATISHTVAGADYADVTAEDVAVTVAVPPGVTVSETTLSVEAAAMATYTVVLDAQPSGNVTVTPATSAAATATVSGALTFTTANWNTAQTVTVTGVAAGTATISHTVAGGGYDSVTAEDVTVTVTAAAAALIVFTDGADTPAAVTSVSVTEESSTRAHYTVALSEDPVVDVTVAISASGSDLMFASTEDGAVAATLSLDFTSANHATAQSVYVTAAGDGDGVMDSATIAHAATAASGNYMSASVDLAATVTDNDPPGVNVSTGFSTNLMDGASDTLTVTSSINLRSGDPDVTLTITSDPPGRATFSESTVTFTSENWNTDNMHAVTVTSTPDPDYDTETVTIVFTLTNPVGPDSPYLTGMPDRDTTYMATENGNQRWFWTVRGRGQGAVAARVNENAPPIPNPNTADPGEPPQQGESRDGTPDSGGSPETLAEDWMYFRFTAVTSGGQSSDNDYRPFIPVTITYCLAGTATGGTAAQVAAEPNSYDFTWPANYDPAETDKLGYSGDCNGRGFFQSGAGSVGDGSGGDWGNIYRLGIQLNDDSLPELDETITAVVLRAVAADGHADIPAGAPERHRVATRTIDDNEERGTVSIAPAAVTVNEGDSVRLTVHLTASPIGELTVPLNAQIRGAPATPATFTPSSIPSRTFTAGTTELTQTFDLAINQSAALNTGSQMLDVEIGTLSGAAASGFDTRGSVVTVDGLRLDGTSTVTINFLSDGLRLNPTNLRVAEGGSGVAYSVSLLTDPGDGETVTVTPNMPAGLSVSPASLTFAGGSGTNPWNTARMFTVTAAEDDNAAIDTLVIEHSVDATADPYMSITDTFDVTVTKTDNDTRGIVLSTASLSLPNNQQRAYTVQLNSEPVGGAVTVTPSLMDTAGGTVTFAINSLTFSSSPGALTFTDSDGATPWNRAQTITVQATNVGTRRIRHTAAGADYADVTADISLNVTAAATAPELSAAVASSVTDTDSNADNGVQVGEDVGSIAFTVSLGGAAITDDVTVQWAVTGVDTATDLSGYPTTAAERTLTFTTTDMAAKTVTLSVVDDSAHESPETLVFAISNAAGTDNPGITTASARVQITNNDSPFIITPRALTVTVGETAEYTVRVAFQPSGEVMVFPTSGDTDTATVRYNFFQNRNNALFWGNTDSWTDSYTVTVTGVAAGSTTITHTLDSGAGNYPNSLTVPSVAVTVNAAPTTPVFQIAVASSVTDADNTADGTQVGEDVTSVAFSVSLAGNAPTASATVDWAVTGVDTATDLTGYPTERTLTFTTANHSTAQTITLSVVDDSLNEALETLTVTLSNATGAAADNVAVSGSAGSAAIQITDNDPIVFTVARATPANGEILEGASQSFTITPSGGGFGGATVLVPWSVAADADSNTGDAAAGDFRATDGAGDSTALLAFPASSTPLSFTDTTAQTVTVHTLNDAAAEGAEVFVLQLGTISGATGGTTAGSQAVTIASSDAALTITCTAVAGLADLVEGTATTVANCSHSNTEALVADVGVGWTVFAGSGVTHATVGSATEATADFSPSTGSLTLPQGTASGATVALQLTATDDSAAEGAEQFSLVLTGTQDTNRRYADLTPAQANYAQDITVAQSTAGGPQFNIAVASSVTDADGDANNGVQVGEDAGSIAFTVTVTGTAPTADIGVAWAVSGVQSGDYTTSATSPLTFTSANHATAQTITLSITDDGVNEAAETLTVTLSSPTGTDTPTIASGAGSAAVQITDNDALTFTVARKTPSTGAITEGNSQVFSVTPGGGTIASGTSVSVPWNIGVDSASATADAAAGDFRATGDTADTTALGAFPSATLTFTSHTAQDVTVWTLDDATGEGAETFQFNFGAISGADGATTTSGAPLAVQIAASDVPTFSVTAETNPNLPLSRHDEGRAKDFIVSGSGPAPTGNVEITCTISSSEAIPGDFQTITGTQVTSGNFPTWTLTFTPSNYNGQQQCQFLSYDDDIAEDTEEFTVTITVTSGNAVIGTASTTGAILRNDFRVGFAATAYSIDEGGLGNSGNFGSNSAQVCIAVTNPPSDVDFPSGFTFALAFSSRDGTAGSSDYTSITNQRAGPFTNSIRRECAVVEVAHDLLNEGAENFFLDLAPPPGQTLDGVTINPSQATITIPADDPLTVTVSGPTQVEEGATAEFTLAFASVDLESPDGMHTETVTYMPTADVVVNWALAGTDITTTDFTGVTSLTTGNSHTITLNNPDYTFDLAVAEEAAQDPDDVPETFSLTVTGGTSNGAVTAAASGASQSVQIVAAGSATPLFTVTGPSGITEGAAGVESSDYTVTLTGLTGATLGTATDVTWTVTHGDTVDADFAAASDRSGTVTFPATAANAATQTFTLTVAADNLNEGSEDFSVQVAASGFRAGAAATTTITDHSADATTVTITKQTPSGNNIAEAGDGTSAGDVTFRVALSGGVRTGVITVPVSFSGLDDAEYDITAPASGDYDNDPTTDDTAPPASAAGLTLTFDLSGTPTATDHQDVTVNLIGDTVNEASESLNFTGAAASATGLRIATGSVSYANKGNAANVAITDDDNISVTIAFSGTDADGTATGDQVRELTDVTFEVKLTDGASTPADITSVADATIRYTIGDADAADYTDRTAATDASTSTNGELVIPAGSSSGTITIRINDDGDSDATEDLTVTLTAANPSATPPVTGPTVGAGGGSIAVTSTAASAAATVKILQSTVTRTLTVTGPAALTETDANAETGDYTITLTGSGGAFASDTTITWTVTHVSTEAADFSAVTGTVTFTSSDAANSTKTFKLTIVGDTVNEAAESFTLQVSGGGTGVGYGTPQSVTITDNDAITYSIAADSATVAEADSAEAEFTVTLSGASEGDVTIPVTLSGTATSGDDYTAPVTTVTVSAGDTTADFDVALVNDAVAEAGETIIATVAAETHVSFAKGDAAGAVTRTATTASQAATVTISANDALSIAIVRKAGEDGDITEAGTTSANFTVTVTGTSAMSVSVPFTVGGTNITAADYDITAPTGIDATATGGTLTIAAGAGQTGEITIQASNDSEAELAETLSVTLTAAAVGPPAVAGPTSTGAGAISISTASATVGITDNDGITATAAAATASSVTEGGSFSITVSIASAHTQDITFTVTPGSTAATTDNDAEAGDYGTATGLTLSAGDTSTDITIAATADELNEGDETFTVTIAGSTTGRASGPAIPLTVSNPTQTLTVQDDASDAITVTLSKQSPAGATAAEDATATFRIALSGGLRTAPVTVPFSFSGLDNPEYRMTSAIVVDDNLATAAAVPHGAATSGFIHFTLSGSPSATDHVDIVVDLQDDNLNEAAETLTLTGAAAGASGLRLRAAGGAIAYATGANTASVGVTDNDPSAYSVADPTAVTEGDSGDAAVSMRFVVSLSPASAGAVVIPYAVSGTATSGTDYTAPSGSITVEANSTSANLDITVLADNLNEPVETIIITLDPETDGQFSKGAASGAITRAATAADYTATGNINDDDGVTLTLSGGGDVAEGANATTTVTLSSGAMNNGVVTVNYTIASTSSTSDNDAESADYTNTSGGSITINTASTLTGSISIAAVNDTLNEGDETFEVRVANTGTSLTGSVTVASSPQTFTIKDAAADAIAVTITKHTPSGNSVDEEASVTFRVALSSTGNAVRTADVVVPFTVTGLDNAEFAITAPTGIADTATGGSVTFGLGGTPAHNDVMEITINLQPDNLNEAAETLTVTGTAPGSSGLRTAGAIGYTSGGNTANISVTDNANDAIRVTISQQAPASDAAAGENATATFRVALSGGVRTSNVFVPFTFSGTLSADSPNEYDITSALDHDNNPATAGQVPGASATGGVVSFGTSSPSATDHVDITVNLRGDDLNEATETLTITGVPPGGGTNVLRVATGGGSIGFASGRNAATLNVSDDDDILYTIDAGPSTAEADSGTPLMQFTVRIDHQSAGDITIPYTLGGTATGGAATVPTRDYTTPGDRTVRIAAGTQSRTFGITLNPDNINEADETIIVTLGASSTVGAAAGSVERHGTAASYTSTGTITDDDSATATLSTTTASRAEGQAFTARVTLSEEARNTGMITVNYTIGSTAATTDNDAEAADYTDTSGGSITINTASTLTGDITVTSVNDALNEGDETFTLAVAMSGTSLPGGVTISGSPLTFTITDDPNDAITVTINRQGAATRDEAGEVTFRIFLSSAGTAVRTADVVVPFAFTGTLNNVEYAITAPTGIGAAATSGMVTFPVAGTPAHDDHMDVTVNLAGDSLNEATETLIITGTAVGASGLRTAGAIAYTNNGDTDMVSVTDDDTTTVSLSGQADFNEGANGAWPVGVDVVSAGAITVNFRVTLSGTGSTVSNVGSDQTLGAFALVGGVRTANGTLTIRAAALGGTITLHADSGDLEGTTRDVTVTLTGVSVAAAGGTVNLSSTPTDITDMATITYRSFDRTFSAGLAATTTTVNVDRDDAPGIQASEDQSTAAGRTITFNVALAHASGGNFIPDNGHVTVNWRATVTGGGASGSNGVDELTGATSGTVRFARDLDNSAAHNCGTTGDTVTGGGALQIPNAATCPPQNVEVQIAHDTINEAAQTVVFTLSMPAGDHGAGTGLSSDVDERVVILASDPITYGIAATASGAEGDSGGGASINLAVTLSGAAGGSDYDAIRIPFMVESAAGVVGVAASGYPATPTPTTVTAATGDDYFVLAGDSGPPTGARDNYMFVHSFTTLDGASPVLSTNITVITVPDTLNEANEDVVITLDATPTLEGTGGGVTRAAPGHTGTATINDDDDLTITMAQVNPAPAANTDLREGTDVTFRITLSGTAQNNTVVAWSAAVGTQQNTDDTSTAGENDERPNNMENPDLAAPGATASSDGGSISGASAVIPAGQTTGEFTITIRQDARKEGLDDTTAGNEEEVVTVTLGAISATTTAAPAVSIASRGITTTATATFNIEENPAATRFLDVTVDNANRDEGEPVVFTVTLTGTPHDAGAAALTVDWTISGTVETGDYSGNASGTLDFGTSFAGSPPSPMHSTGTPLTRTVRTTITNDNLNEASETLILTLSNIQGGSCPIMPGANCQPPTVSNTESATVTIADDDPITYALASPSNSDESAAVTFAVNLSAASEGDITVAYTIGSTGTATGGAATLMTRDYTTPDPLTVMIPAGSTTAQLEIAVNDDDLNEADETIIVDLSAETETGFNKAAAAGAVTRSATATDQTQTATIRDNDAITISVARTSPSGNDEVEEGTAVTFTVTMAGAAGGSAGTVSIPWTARMVGQAAGRDPAGDPASNDADTPDLTGPAGSTSSGGVEVTGTLEIAAGLTGTVVITPTVDGIGEADERFTFSLGSPTNTAAGGRVSNGSPTSVTVGINENEAALHRVNVVAMSASVAEDADSTTGTASTPGSATFNISLTSSETTGTNARMADLIVAYTIGGTATGGASTNADRDFTWPSGCTAHATDNSCTGTVTFPDGDDSDQTVTVNFHEDRIDDDAETVTITLNALDGTNGASDGADETMFPGTAAAAGGDMVTIADNDVAGIAILQSDGTAIPDTGLPVRSSADTTYTVALTSQPAAGDVDITPTITPVTDPVVLTLADSGGTAVTMHTFTVANWYTAQTITVTAGSVVADDSFRIDYAVTSDTATDAPAYAGVTGGVAVEVSAAVSLISSDTETASGRDPATVTMADPLVQVAGQTNRYPITLGADRTGEVTLALQLMCVDSVDDTCGVTAATTAATAAGRAAAESPSVRNHGGPHLSPASPTANAVFASTVNTMVVEVEIPPESRGDWELQVTGITATAADAYYRDLPTQNLRVAIRAVAPFNTAVDNLNRVILPEVARALADSQMQAIGNRLHRFRSGDHGSSGLNLGGQSTVDGVVATNMQTLADDDINWKRMLADSSFHMPLAGDGGAAGGLGAGAFYGGGEYRGIGGDSDGIDWDGEITGGHLGFDARVGDSSLAGLLVHYGDADIDHKYTDNTPGGRGASVEGDWTLEMTTVNPYFGWKRGAVEGWALAGFGEGDLEIDETGPNRDLPLETDVSMTTFGFGLSGSVVREDGREVRVKAEAFSTTADVDEGDAVGRYQARIEELEVDANRVRVMVESSRTRSLRSGADFGSSAEVGLRYDGGDGRTGGGSELGLGFHYTSPGGVSVEGRARGLLGHRADYDDWGVSGSLKLQPGADGQGLSLALTPAYGQTANGAQSMWDNGLIKAADAANGDATADNKIDLQARMEVAAGYGVKAFTDTGLLTPYSGLTFADTGKTTIKLGVEWQTALGGLSDLGLNLSAKRTPADDTFTLKGVTKPVTIQHLGVNT